MAKAVNVSAVQHIERRALSSQSRVAMRAAAAICAAIGVATSIPHQASAWSLKTHVWIAQEVLNDALDGKVTLAGREYSLPPHVFDALTKHPERYRMGALGPDVFPDPIVGQTTTHPGLAGGWQTDDWLRQLLGHARDSEQVAFAYGFVAHAAADVFAHTWVNVYAGDIFELTDSEREVERRHFLLEKYVEGLTPVPLDRSGRAIDLTRDLGTATSFLRDVLIMNSNVAGQYEKTPSAAHLAAMFRVRQAAQGLDDATQSVIGQLSSWAARYFEMEFDLQAQLMTGEAQLKVADGALATQEHILEARRAAVELQKKLLQKAQDVYKNNQSLIDIQTAIVAEQAKHIAKAMVELAGFAKTLSDIDAEINNVLGAIGSAVCDVIGWLTPEGIKDACNKLNNLRNDLSFTKQKQELAANSKREAERLRDEALREIDRLKEEFDKAAVDIGTGALQLAIDAAELDQRLQEEVVKTARERVAEARRFVERIRAELDPVKAIIAEVKKAFDNYNLVTLLIRNWIRDMDRSAEEYIKTGHDAGIAMLNNQGSPGGKYWHWIQCWGSVFMAQPSQIGEVGCFVVNELERIKSEYDKAVDSLPEILRWLIAPSREAQRQALKRLDPEIRKAKEQLLGFVGTLTSDPETVDFLTLLSDPASASRERLNEAYRGDRTGKRLLRFDNIAALVDRDLKGPDGRMRPDTFAPLSHSVTLVKLSLLDAAGINQLVLDLTNGLPSPRFGSSVYPVTPGSNFTLLLDMVRSIDGNHQWQAFGLPYPRSNGVRLGDEREVRRHHYGHDHFQDAARGLRIWVDPFLRDRVFLTLFPLRMLGALADRVELGPGMYPFPECSAEPFPATQDPRTGRILLRSSMCTDPATASAIAGVKHFADAAGYSRRYFQCDEALAGVRHWTVVASMLTRAGAERRRNAIIAAYPDMAPEVWEPSARNRYWTVMAAGCTSAERAGEARALAVRRGIASDAYVWEQRAPWRRYQPAQPANDAIARRDRPAVLAGPAPD